MHTRKCNKGFTLIEVLIVITLIGILAGAMLLARWGGEAAARATTILTDLRVMKSGAYAFLADSADFNPLPDTNYALLLGKYMDHRTIVNEPHRYSFYVQNDLLWVGVRCDELKRIGEILEAKAQSGHSMPLYGTAGIAVPPSGAVDANRYQANHAAVWTPAR